MYLYNPIFLYCLFIQIVFDWDLSSFIPVPIISEPPSFMWE